MANQPKPHQHEVKVEDLLRLKRAERPDDAFWGQFDRELHQRMLQTLVKKDPLHLQVLRALSGRFAQSLAVAGAAAFLALMVVRPAFVGTEVVDMNLAKTEAVQVEAIAAVEVAMADLDIPKAVGPHDYKIERISAELASTDAAFTRDFGIEGFQMAFESADYSSDAASARPAFGSTGVASLVY